MSLFAPHHRLNPVKIVNPFIPAASEDLFPSPSVLPFSFEVAVVLLVVWLVYALIFWFFHRSAEICSFKVFTPATAVLGWCCWWSAVLSFSLVLILFGLFFGVVFTSLVVLRFVFSHHHLPCGGGRWLLWLCCFFFFCGFFFAFFLLCFCCFMF
jgi:hypothetical protein